MTAKSSNNDATTTVSRSYFSEYAGYATIFSWMLTAACCLAVGLGLGLDLVCGYAHVIVLLSVVIVTLFVGHVDVALATYRNCAYGQYLQPASF